MSAEALSETFDRPSSRMCFPFLFLIFSIQAELLVSGIAPHRAQVDL